MLKVGEVVNNYLVNEYLKTTKGGGSESYMVTTPSGKRGLMKLFSIESVASSVEYGISQMLTMSDKSIANVLDSGMVSHRGKYFHYLVREVVDGERLSDILDKGKKYEWPEAVGIARQILSALKHLHDMHPTILHNDITPRNIVLREQDGRRLLTLIGLGNLATPANGRSIEGLNPVYLAPEALEGTFDIKTDIFSVGVVMYRMLTGFEPWSLPNKSMSVARVRMLRRTYGDNPLSTVEDKYRNFFRRILALDPAERFATIDEVLEALDDVFNIYMSEIDDERKKIGEARKIFMDSYREEIEKRLPSRRKARVVVKPAKSTKKRVKTSRLPGTGLDRVAGLEDVKNVLRRNVMFVLQNEDKAERYGLKAPNGMLLYGPPGCGKTFVAEMFAEESGLNFKMVKASDLGSSYIHGTQGKIAELFAEARAKAPMVICFDELDGMIPNRSEVHSEFSAGEVNEFLSQLNNCSDRGIFVIGTTNRPEKIDPAVLRTGRMDKILYVDMPNTEARKELFRLNIGRRYTDDAINLDTLATATEGYIASDIAYIVNEAALTAAIDDVPLSEAILLAQITATRSSLSKDDIAEYERMRQRYDSQNSRTPRRKLGFNVQQE